MDIFAELLYTFSPHRTGFLFMWVLSVLAFVLIVLVLERYVDIRRRTSINASLFIDELLVLIKKGDYTDALNLCRSGGERALARIVAAALERAQSMPPLIQSSMEEAALGVTSRLEKRLNAIMVCGNMATLIGLMGTIYGLILSFAAVAQEGVSPVEKTSMLASGISAAMNTTLLGLMIAAPSVLAFALLRGRIDRTLGEIDRYAITILKALGVSGVSKTYRLSSRRIMQETDIEPNMVPFMNLMVVLIPLLLSSTEFIKLGMIELKLPQSLSGDHEGEKGSTSDTRLNLSVVITMDGFRVIHEMGTKICSYEPGTIPLSGEEYDFEGLSRSLAEVKFCVLLQLLRSAGADIPAEPTLYTLYREYRSMDFSEFGMFSDHENIAIAAEETVNYQTVISVIDAAREVALEGRLISMFPNVSITGGIAK